MGKTPVDAEADTDADTNSAWIKVRLLKLLAIFKVDCIKKNHSTTDGGSSEKNDWLCWQVAEAKAEAQGEDGGAKGEACPESRRAQEEVQHKCDEGAEGPTRDQQQTISSRMASTLASRKNVLSFKSICN